MSKLVVEFGESTIKEWGSFDKKKEKIIEVMSKEQQEEGIDVELGALLCDILARFNIRLCEIIADVTKDKNLNKESDTSSGAYERVYTDYFELDNDLTDDVLELLKEKLEEEFGHVNELYVENEE